MLLIRDATPEDARRLLDIYRPYVENTAISFEYETPSLDAFQSRIQAISAHYPYLVLEQDGEIAGYAYAGVFKPRAAYARSCEVTIYLDPRVQKRGLGRMLYEALEQRLRALGILNLYACIAWPPAPDPYLTTNSADFHAHIGYTKVGEFHFCAYKFGRWYHMIWMEKFIGGHGE